MLTQGQRGSLQRTLDKLVVPRRDTGYLKERLEILLPACEVSPDSLQELIDTMLYVFAPDGSTHPSAHLEFLGVLPDLKEGLPCVKTLCGEIPQIRWTMIGNTCVGVGGWLMWFAVIEQPPTPPAYVNVWRTVRDSWLAAEPSN